LHLNGIRLARLRKSKVASANLPCSAQICNPSPHFTAHGNPSQKVEEIISSRIAKAEPLRPDGNRRRKTEQAFSKATAGCATNAQAFLAELVGVRKKVEEIISSRIAKAEPLRLDGNRRRKTEQAFQQATKGCATNA